VYRHKLVQVIRKCVQFYTDRQTVDSNVTRRMVIAYWIIKCTDTNVYDGNEWVECNLTVIFKLSYVFYIQVTLHRD